MIDEDCKYHHPIIKDICTQEHKEILFLYEKALETEFTPEYNEKINALMMHTHPIFKKTYLKAIRLMKKSGIVAEKFIDPLTEKTCYKPTMLLLHWWLYVVDDMIASLYEQQQEDKSKGVYKELASMEIYWSDISKNTEYEEIEKILEFPYHMVPKYESLLICKKALLLLLNNISDIYKAARKRFIHYKNLLEAVTKGYIALDEDCYTDEVKWRLNEYKEKDNLQSSEDIPTFERSYRLGAIENIKSSSKKCYDRLSYWNTLIGQEKLNIIFSAEKMKTLKEAFNEECRQFNIEMREAIFKNKYFNFDRSYGHLIQYLL
ncbi:hypothetical protein [Bartonella massiliensis]|uniref:hypothetical protein n=1 Tax=Bartonella massiliensis TaxID=929795 RepID=UPI00115AE3CA|nr:hypothetical protein [Bartonella massiliensis]